MDRQQAIAGTGTGHEVRLVLAYRWSVCACVFVTDAGLAEGAVWRTRLAHRCSAPSDW
jgi:hypothetical protein